MPFGLANAPTTFQATMYQLFKPLLWKFVIIFLDDILVYIQNHHFVYEVVVCLSNDDFYVNSQNVYLHMDKWTIWDTSFVLEEWNQTNKKSKLWYSG